MRFAHEVLMNPHSFLDFSCVCACVHARAHVCMCVCGRVHVCVCVFGSSDHFFMINQS